MNENITVKIFLTDNKSFADFEKFIPELPFERQRKIASLIREPDKLLSAAAGLLIKRELPEDAEVLYTEKGKPYAINHPEIHFSVSHTKGAVVFVRADSPIGVDIEQNKAFKDFDRIAEKHFSPDEYDFCRGNSARFFEIWTKKEAYIKMTGKGLSEVLKTFSVMSDNRILSAHYGEYIISVCSLSCINKQLIIDETIL